MGLVPRSIRRAHVLSLLLVPLASGAVFSCADHPAGGPSAEVRKFIGEDAVAILSKPEKVESFRLLNRRDDLPLTTQPDRPRFHNHPITATGPTLDAAFGKRLAAVFFDAASYDFNSAKGCKFDPGVGFRVWSGGRYADLLLCFSCDEWVMHVVDVAGKDVRRVGEDFDRTRPALVRLAKEAFPNDATLQSLAERKD